LPLVGWGGYTFPVRKRRPGYGCPEEKEVESSHPRRPRIGLDAFRAGPKPVPAL
jgi:hypothetical protein